MLRAKRHTFCMICGGNIGGSDNIRAHLKKSQTDSFSFNSAKSNPKLQNPNFAVARLLDIQERCFVLKKWAQEEDNDEMG